MGNRTTRCILVCIFIIGPKFVSAAKAEGEIL